MYLALLFGDSNTVGDVSGNVSDTIAHQMAVLYNIQVYISATGGQRIDRFESNEGLFADLIPFGLVDMLDEIGKRRGAFGPQVAMEMLGSNDYLHMVANGPFDLAKLTLTAENIIPFARHCQWLGVTPVVISPPPLQNESVGSDFQLFRSKISNAAAYTGAVYINGYALIDPFDPLNYRNPEHLSAAGNLNLVNSLIPQLQAQGIFV